MLSRKRDWLTQYRPVTFSNSPGPVASVDRKPRFGEEGKFDCKKKKKKHAKNYATPVHTLCWSNQIWKTFHSSSKPLQRYLPQNICCCIRLIRLPAADCCKDSLPLCAPRIECLHSPLHIPEIFTRGYVLYCFPRVANEWQLKGTLSIHDSLRVVDTDTFSLYTRQTE